MTSFIVDQQKSYRHLGWNELLGRLAAFWLLYSLGSSQRAGNFDHGFWLIQKLDHSANLPKNPVILWSNFFTLGSLSYYKFLKIHLFSSVNAQCVDRYFKVLYKLNCNSHMEIGILQCCIRSFLVSYFLVIPVKNMGSQHVIKCL